MYKKLAKKENYGAIRNLSRIKYIVIHFTANNGDTAKNNLNYFSSHVTNTSAHYFVDEFEVCQSVDDNLVAYHCGGGLQGKNGHSFYNKCTNTNSIGVELCSRKNTKGEYYFKDETIKNAVNFVHELMKKYNISSTNVIRHFDVTGKICPAPFVYNTKAWDDFKNMLINGIIESEEEDMKYYQSINEIPFDEGKQVIEKLVKIGVIKGDGKGLNISDDMIRILTYLKRLDIIKI